MKEKLIGPSDIGLINRGLFYGENIFTSFSTFEKHAPFLMAHIDRLKRGIEFFYPELIKYENYFNDLQAYVKGCLKASEKDLYFRVTLLTSLDREKMSLHILSRESDPCFNRDKDLTIIKKDWPKSDFKNLTKIGNYAESFYYLEKVKKNKFDDFLKVNLDGEVLEASTSNIIFEKEGKWYTPKKENSFLSGVILENLKTLYPKKLIERKISLSEIKDFEKAFLTNGVDYLVNVNKIEDTNFTSIFSGGEKISTVKKIFMWE